MEGDLAGVRLAEGGEHVDTPRDLPSPQPRAPDGSCRYPVAPPRRPPRRGRRWHGPTSPRRRTSPTADQPDSTRARPTARCCSPMPNRRWASDRFVSTLDANQLRLAKSRCAINQSRGGRAEHHPTGRSDRLHPLGHPHLLTDRGVTERPRTHFTGDHLTGVQAHPQLQLHTVAILDLGRRAASPPPECPRPPGRHEQRGPPTRLARRTPP